MKTLRLLVSILFLLTLLIPNLAWAAGGNPPPTPAKPASIMVSTSAKAETMISVYQIMNLSQWKANGWVIGARLEYAAVTPADCQLHTRAGVPNQVYARCAAGVPIRPIPETGGEMGFVYRVCNACYPITIRLFGN